MHSFVEDFRSQAALIFWSSSNGKCVSAAVLVSPFDDFTVSRNVISAGDNVEAEVDGIFLALEALLSSSKNFPSLKHGIVVSDCEAALCIVMAQTDFT